jgi:hypothetical protein
VYLFESNNAGFGGCFLIKKQIEHGERVKEGTWDSIHIVTADLDRQTEGKARYKVISTVFLKMISVNAESYGNLEIAGNLIRTKDETFTID